MKTTTSNTYQRAVEAALTTTSERIQHGAFRRTLLSLAAACAVPFAFAQPIPVHHNLTPGVSTRLTIKTLPNAVCTLSVEGSSDPQRSLKLYADDEGTMYFDATPPANLSAEESTAAIAHLQAQCQANGQVLTHSIELQPAVGTAATVSASARTLAKKPQPGQKVRPALTGDPLSRTNEELVAAGYPPRPDPVQAPDAYATWLKAVSKPSIQITPKTVATERSHGPVKSDAPSSSATMGGASLYQVSNNWSGFVLQKGPTPYNLVIGNWYVPYVTGESNMSTYSSLWVGLDGWGSNDVVQAGTEQDVLIETISGSKWLVSSYFAWYEWFSNSTPLEQLIHNFPVYPGDEMYSEVWVGTPSTANAYGNSGFFFVENISEGYYVEIQTTKPSGDTFVGNTAEWVLERTGRYACSTCSPTWNDLPDYGTANMFNAYAERQDGAVVAYNAVSNDLLQMTNGVDRLSTVLGTGPTSMQFRWLAFH
jgi:hypothetical protein